MQQTTQGQLAPEVRQVTILKCDIVDSTRITAALDLEGQLNFERGFHDIVMGLAQRFEADMERFEGDGAFLILGLSRPREDAAECALRLARELVSAVEGWRLIPDVAFQLRVGVASGPVAAVKHSELHSIAGHTINRAQRLLQEDHRTSAPARGTRSRSSACNGTCRRSRSRRPARNPDSQD